MNRERLDTFCERGILALVLGALVFGVLATGAVRAQDFAVVQYLTLGAAALWLARLWLAPRPQLLWPPLNWVVLAFTGYAVARYFTADLEYIARQELLRVVVYALMFLVVVNNVYRQDAGQWLVLTLLFLGLGVALYAVYQFCSGSDRVWWFISPYQGRAGGTFVCPNHLAGFLEMLLPLALAAVVVGRFKLALKVVLGYAAVMMAAGIAVSISRGGWLATAGSLLCFAALLLLRKNFRLPTLLAVTVILLAGGCFIAQTDFAKARLKKAFPEGNPQKVEDVRFELWRPAVQLWREHVWFGVGPGHFDSIFPAYRPQRLQVTPRYVHNDYLNTLADWGVVGGMFMLGALGCLAWGAVKTWRHVRGGARELGGNRSNKFAVVLGATVGLVAILLHSVVDFNMQIPANALLAVTLMALLTAHLRFATDNFWFTVRLPARMALSVLLLAGIILVGLGGMQAGREALWLAAAARAPFASSARIDALKKAFAIEPRNADTALAIGECFRIQSWDGNRDYVAQATAALEWFNRARALNPFSAHAYLYAAMCLDWLERSAEAAPLVQRALVLDGNNYFLLAHIGWHYEQIGDLAAARACYLRSLRLDYRDNAIAATHLRIISERMADTAARGW